MYKRQARVAAQTVQRTAKATVSAAKAAIAGTKAVIAAITAGGWAAVAIILVLCVVGLIASSCFGIFFSGEDNGTGQTMRQAVQEINADYQSQIDTARADSHYNELEMSGSRAVWPEVLAVYAVKTTTDPDDPQEVATVDDAKKAILKDIFWQMNEISSHTESKTEEVITETDDGHGNIVETTTTVTRTYLYITVSHKTAEEMADRFSFNADQRQQLSELLDEENRKLWSSVLYGIYSGDDTVDYGEDGLYNTGVPDTITIENCHIIGKTNITQSGFLGGYASGANRIVISNCSVGRDVVIGCDKDQDRIGSLAGDFNGTIVNCTSAATVYGVNRVGGLVGAKGQSMGLCDVMSSSFTGKVIATGNYVGGIMGVGYVANSAPNSPWALVQGCFVSGSVEGKDYVGGITGGEPGVLQCWGNGAGVICDNVFYGTLSATGKNVGAIAGKIRSLNKYTEVDNNYYLADCGAEKGIGAIDLVDTTCKDYPAVEDGRYICSREGYEEPHFMAGDFSREDDPLGADADKLAKTVTAKELTDGTVVAWLNGSDHSYHNWIQGENGPVISDKPVAYALAVSGDYKTTYTIGDELDLSGLVLTATWTDGSTTEVDLADVEITGFDTNQRGEQTVTLAYGAAKVTITVTVLLPAGKDITVSFMLLGDSAHGDSGDKHTLADNNLETWIDTTKVTVSNNATVLDVILAVCGDRFDIKNESGNYIQAITPKDGTELAEFTNGNLSGWMYTLNGVHPNLGVAQQYLNEGDVIVFHYTDDYLKEYEAEQNRTKTAEEVIAMIDAIGTVDLSKAGAISAARSAYDKLTDAEKALVTNYDVLVEAEAEYARLAAEQGKKIDNIYTTTGDYISGLGTPDVGSIGGEWMVIDLARSGRTVPDGYYEKVVEYVQKHADENERLHRAKSTDNSRIILALTAIGKDVTNVGGHNLLKGLDSMDYIQTQGINGPIWALIALDSHNYPTSGDVTREKLIQVILDAQLPGGGWNLSGNDADPDMTAMAIQALAPYYKENDAVKAAVDKALDVLSELQLATGGFGSWGTENSESCAQVIVALTALDIDPAKDSRFIKNGLTILDALASYYVDGGGFRHIASGDRDGMATEQGYYALAAYYRFLNGQTRLYDMSDVTIKANDQPTDPTTPVTPATGDNQPVVLWFGSVLISGAAILLLAQKKKKVR